MRSATMLSCFRVGVSEIDHAQHDLLRRQLLEYAEIELGLRGLDRNLVRLAGVEFAQKRIAHRLLALDDRRIAETEMHDGRSLQAVQRAVKRLDRDALGGGRILTQPGLVELDHVGAGLFEIARLRIHRGGKIHHHLVVVFIVFVDRLPAHGERTRQRDLRHPPGIAAKEFHVAGFDRMGAADRTDDAWHGSGQTGLRCHFARLAGGNAFERGRKTVGVAFAPYLAIGNDVDAGALHVADRKQRCIVLRLLQPGLGDAPQIEPHPRHAL